MGTISVLVITKNEEARLPACLDSIAGLAHEIVVIDSGSTDGTTEIAKRYTDMVHFHKFEDFPRQRNIALDHASGDWVFFIDADEVCTTELTAELTRIAGQEPTDEMPVAYGIPRRNYMFGRWMRHAGWYPDYQYRFFRRDKGRYDEDRRVHELALFDGPAGVLENVLLHYNYDSLGEFCAKQQSYAELEAQTRAAAGNTAKWRNFILQPMREFRRRFFALGGHKEGALGFVLSVILAYYDFQVYYLLKRYGGRTESLDRRST
jgi:(heptosyl)LPS beta-1,4-glucosyltransferase